MMEENNKNQIPVNNNEVINKKKSSKGLIIFLVLIIIGLLTYVCLDYLGVVNLHALSLESVEVEKECNCKEETNNKDKQTNNEVTIEEKKEVTKIIGLTENGLKGLSKEELNDDVQYNSSKKYSDLSQFNVASIFIYKDEGTYNLSDFKADEMDDLIMKYSYAYGLDKFIKCYDTEENCGAIEVSEYDSIKNKYNFNKSLKTTFVKQNNYVYFPITGWLSYTYEVEDSINFAKENEIITVSYNVNAVGASITSQDDTIKKKITFVFKKVNDSYILDKFVVKNNK